MDADDKNVDRFNNDVEKWSHFLKTNFEPELVYKNLPSISLICPKFRLREMTFSCSPNSSQAGMS